MTPEMESLLEEIRDNPNIITGLVISGAVDAALKEIERLRTALNDISLHAQDGGVSDKSKIGDLRFMAETAIKP